MEEERTTESKPLLSENFLGGQTVHNLIIIGLLAYTAYKVGKKK